MGIETIAALVAAMAGAGATAYGAKQQTDAAKGEGKKAGHKSLGQELNERRNPLNTAMLDRMFQEFLGAPEGFGQTYAQLMGSNIPQDRQLAELLAKPKAMRTPHEQALVQLFETQGIEGMRKRQHMMAYQYNQSRKRSDLGPIGKFRWGLDPFMSAMGKWTGVGLPGDVKGKGGQFNPWTGLNRPGQGGKPQFSASGAQASEDTGVLPPSAQQGQGGNVGPTGYAPGMFDKGLSGSLNADIISPQELAQRRAFGFQDIQRQMGNEMARTGLAGTSASLQAQNTAKLMNMMQAQQERIQAKQMNRQALTDAQSLMDEIGGLYS